MSPELIDQGNKENYSLLAVAYYNVGSQFEFLNQLEECRAAFLKAIQILRRHFDESYPLIFEFQKSLKIVERKISLSSKPKPSKCNR